MMSLLFSNIVHVRSPALFDLYAPRLQVSRSPAFEVLILSPLAAKFRLTKSECEGEVRLFSNFCTTALTSSLVPCSQSA
jgi:hypothetical protein